MPTRKVKFAEDADIEEQARHWSPGQLACRSGLYSNHNWEPHDGARYPGQVFLVIQKCENCDNRRSRRINGKTGRWMDDSWNPIYEKGYLMPPGKGRIGADGKALLMMQVLPTLGITKTVNAGDRRA